MQAVSQLYLPDKFSRASQLYGAIGITVVTLGWFFIAGRVIMLAMVLNAVHVRTLRQHHPVHLRPPGAAHPAAPLGLPAQVRAGAADRRDERGASTTTLDHDRRTAELAGRPRAPPASPAGGDRRVASPSGPSRLGRGTIGVRCAPWPRWSRHRTAGGCPSPDDADRHGLVGVGADLEPGTLLAAYRAGLFPMPMRKKVVGWWSPDPRGIIPLDGLRVTRSLRQSCRRYEVRIDTRFREVMERCGDPRRPHGWITPAFVDAYTRLHELGWAHSVETYLDGELVGGLYGVRINGLFAGESMFHTARDASKVALVALVDAPAGERARRCSTCSGPPSTSSRSAPSTSPAPSTCAAWRLALAVPPRRPCEFRLTATDR